MATRGKDWLPMIGGKLGAHFKHDPRTLKLSRYLDQQAIRWRRVPEARDWWASRDPNGHPVPYDYDALGNDRYGDCVLAGPGHYVNLQARINGHDNRVTEGMVLSAYSDLTGFDPITGEGDNGTFVLDMLKAWKATGLYGTRIEAYLAVDFTNADELAAACELFGGVFVGFDLPITINGQDVWDVTDPKAKIEGGHLVYQHAWSPGMHEGNSWGGRAPWTPAFMQEYAHECWAVLCSIALSGEMSPCGLMIDDLRSDLRARGAL